MLKLQKDKGQALVEFLTADDASAALSFDGSMLFGSIVKIRRPKDYIEVAVRTKTLSIRSFFHLYHITATITVNIMAVKVFDIFLLELDLYFCFIIDIAF